MEKRDYQNKTCYWCDLNNGKGIPILEVQKQMSDHILVAPVCEECYLAYKSQMTIVTVLEPTGNKYYIKHDDCKQIIINDDDFDFMKGD